jgi:tripartite-type tricarboxylate transporter receptor subunit TctC
MDRDELRPAIRAWKLAALAVAAVATSQNASAADDFYKGKQITIIVSGSPGGIYDGYGRILGRYLSKYIPGNPTYIIQGMSGASGLQAANYIYNQAPKDGTVIAGTHSHIPTAPLLDAKGTQYDQKKLSWIGSVTTETFIGYVWHTSPVQSLEEAKTKEIIVGGQAVGSMSIDMPILAREMLNLKMKIVTGYSGSQETKIALERGEIHGNFGNSYTSLITTQPDWLRDKQIKVITQFGFKKHPQIPDAPLFMDFLTDPQDRQAIELMAARQQSAKPYFAPPGIPPERLRILRDAFNASLKDPAFKEELLKAQYEFTDPMTGEELEAMVNRLSETPPSVAKHLDSIFAKFREKP